jgi:bifunctional UDP-N-acetylglucosamine pyrophosphorylase / glucosamine-1-phosphate N-acetyltransferase
METEMTKIRQLIEAGIQIPNPESVFIAEDVDPSRISGNNVVIHAGCKIFGASTLILQGANLGYEAPVTMENCQVGPDVTLTGGFFKGAVFLEKASVGSGAHVREGTILEEQAGAAHTVGLKQTILFPFVTLGSLINFCDCFMSGGTSRKDHSEVGSSFIHFNYTPNQDKATPSLIGDVPRGVMLNQRPIFLGGHGGIVGPCRLAFGTVTAAGTICRKDELRSGRLIASGLKRDINIPYMTSAISNVKKIAGANILYMANLLALNQWYDHVRTAFFSTRFPETLYAGLKQKLAMAIDERLRQLKAYCMNFESASGNSDQSLNTMLMSELKERWNDLEHYLQESKKIKPHAHLIDPFLEGLEKTIQKEGKNYIAVIKGLPKESSESGTRWLQNLVDRIIVDCSGIIPSLK